jgi:hypothetical protein
MNIDEINDGLRGQLLRLAGSIAKEVQEDAARQSARAE